MLGGMHRWAALVFVCTSCLSQTNGYLGPNSETGESGADGATGTASDEGLTNTGTGDGDSGDGDGTTGDGTTGDGDGTTGACTVMSQTVDDFETLDYAGGSGDWVGPWDESWGAGDGDPVTGLARVEQNGGSAVAALSPGEDTSPGLVRTVDLSEACSAELSLMFRSFGVDEPTENLQVQARPDPTAGWTEIASFDTADSMSMRPSGAIDLAGYLTAAAQIRIRSQGPNTENGDSYFDDVTINVVR